MAEEYSTPPAFSTMVLPEGLTPAIQVENTKDKSHGDFASNIALMLASRPGSSRASWPRS